MKKILLQKNKIVLFFGVFVLLNTLILTILYLLFAKNNSKGQEIESIMGNYATLIKFTTLSNLFLGIMMILYPLKPKNEMIKSLFYSSVVLITVTLLVYAGFISWRYLGTWTNGLLATRSILTHLINPILAFIALILFRKSITISKKEYYISSAIVFVYFLFALILFYSTDSKTIYSFLDFTNPLFYKNGNLLIVNILRLVIFLLAITFGFLFTVFWEKILKIKNTEPFFKSLKKKAKK